MKPLKVSELPSLDEPPRDGARVRRSARRPRVTTRRQFIRRVLIATMAFSVASIAKLPPARRAFAGHAGTNDEGYEILGSCPSYASGHNCHYHTGARGCGPSAVRKAACHYTPPDCCGGVHPHEGWHRRDTAEWALRPNQCAGGEWDGWNWRYAGKCGHCGDGITYRCHDGYRWPRDNTRRLKTICRGVVECRAQYSSYQGPPSGGYATADEGTYHMIEVRGTDRAGNVEQSPASEAWWSPNG